MSTLQSAQTRITQYLVPLVELTPLQNAQLPLFPLTYSLWRTVCFQTVVKALDVSQKQELTKLKQIFLKVSERQIFPQFVKRVKEQMDKRALGWKQAVGKDQNLKVVNVQAYQEIVKSYSQAIYTQQIYVQMFYDLVTIVYSPVYEEKSLIYKLDARFDTRFYQQKEEGFINRHCNRFGKNLLSNGLHKISQAVVTKSFLYGMIGTFGSFNPVMMATSYIVSTAIEKTEKDRKMKQIVDELEILKEETLKNIKILEETYEQCLCMLECMPDLNEKEFIHSKQKYKTLLSKVLIEDWLEIKTRKQGEWQIVHLKENDNFIILESEDNVIDLKQHENITTEKAEKANEQ